MVEWRDMPADMAHIPPSLLCRLSSLRPTLEKNGTVMLRREKGRNPCYRIRVRVFDQELGYIKQRAILLGDERVAGAVRELLAKWKWEHRSALLAVESRMQEQKRIHRLLQG